jgi:decaprenyl-phosphate phosphoribosyltransferase
VTKRSIVALIVGLLRAARPRQWLKNVLVVAVPLAAGELLSRDVLLNTAVAFVAFCVAASGVYLLNDVKDVEADRHHPSKRDRPVASGLISPSLAVSAGIVLLLAAMGVAALASPALVVTVTTYVAFSLLYVLWLKHEPVIDLALVASGFVLRAVAGGAAAGIQPSQWFLLVAAFGALFMVSGKRYSEYRAVELSGTEIGLTRRSLREYTPTYLRFVWSTAAAVAITAYSLWAFELTVSSGTIYLGLSIVAFVLAILRYARDIDGGLAGEPEDVVLRDRTLQSLGLVWLVLFALGLSLGA